MAKNAIYSTTNTQVIINPNKNNGNFLDELNDIISEKRDAFSPQAILYTPDAGSLGTFKYKREATKFSNDTMYHLIGGDVLVICAKKSDIDNPLKLLADDLDLYDDPNHASIKHEDGLVLPKDLVPICKIWYNGDSGIPHVDFIENHDILFNPAKLYDLAMKYSVDGNNKSEVMMSASPVMPQDIVSSTNMEIPLQKAME